MATAVCAVLSVRLLTMTCSSFLLSTCCLTLIFAVRIIFTNPSTCADLQSSRQQISALADIGNKYMLITSKDMLFSDIHKRNLVKIGEKYKLNLTGMQALSFEEKFPDFTVEIKFGDHSKTRIFIADTDKGTVLGVLEKDINLKFYLCSVLNREVPKSYLYVYNIRGYELMYKKKKKRVKGQPSWVRPYPHSRVATSEFSIFNWKSYLEEPKIREKHICKHSIVTQASSTTPPATTFTSTTTSQVSLQNQNKKDGPTTEQASGTSGTPSKLPVSTDTSSVFAVTGRTSSTPSTASKAGSKATDLKTSKFSFTTVQSIVSSLTNKIANALGRKSKVNIADIAPKTSTTCTPTTTSPILKKSKLSKSKVSKAAPKVSKVSTALTASRVSAASKKFKKTTKK